jgi:hypothetical protein
MFVTLFRNPDGFSSVDEGEVHGAYRRAVPFAYREIFEDFTSFVSTAGSPAYTFTSSQGSQAALSMAAPDTAVIKTAGNSGNSGQLYLSTAAMAFVPGKRGHFRCRCKIQKGSGGTLGSEAIVIGVTNVATGTAFMNNAGAARTYTDGIAFTSYKGATTFNCSVTAGNVESVRANAFSYANDTWMELAFDYDGSAIGFYADGNLVAQFSAALPSAAVTPMLFVQTGEGAAKVLLTDYVWLALER